MVAQPSALRELHPDRFSGIPSTLAELRAVLTRGENRNLEFKRSTGELKEAAQTLCAFLNEDGGMVLFGIRPDGRPDGQQVSDKTLRDIAQALERFEPPINIPVHRSEWRASRPAGSRGDPAHS